MSDVVTPILGLTKPDVGADIDVWGDITNSNWDIVDASPALHNIGRNLLHNPLFRVQQRGLGAWTTNNTYTADRWVMQFAGGTMQAGLYPIAVAQAQTIGDEAAEWQLGCVFAGTAGTSDYTSLVQRIESVRRLTGQTVTLSFWAIASAAGMKLGAGVYQFFGTGGSPSAGVQINGQAVTLTTGWARYSLTFAIPSASGKTLGTNGDDYTQVAFYYSAAPALAAATGSVGVQSGTITLWGVQLEVGSRATPLEKPDPSYDVASCQRFFLSSFVSSIGYQAAGSGFLGTAFFPVTMRVNPTINIIGTPTLYNVPSVAAGGAMPGCVTFQGIATASAPTGFALNYIASADL
jgi:hypothetical protein